MQQSRNIREGWVMETFDSFEEAAAADKRKRLAMTPNERMRITEELRATYYGYAETGVEPRFERVIESVPLP